MTIDQFYSFGVDSQSSDCCSISDVNIGLRGLNFYVYLYRMTIKV